MSTAMISVILPTYNRAYILDTAVKSVLAQTYPHFELIIIDDGSTDNTEEIAMSYQDERIKYFRIKENAGQAKARNFGVERARYDYIAFQDSDDVWHPEKLTKQMKEMLLASPEVGFVYHKIRYDMGNGCVAILPFEHIALEKKSGNIFDQLLYDNLVPCPSVLVKKECFLRTGGFDETMKSLEDYDLALKLAQNYKALFVDEILLEAAYSTSGVSGNPVNFLVASCRILQKYKREYLRTNTLNHRIENIINNAEKIGRKEQFIKLIELSLM